MKITLDKVVKTFDTFRAVHGVSLEIESGELLALLGPSGSGKTTILRMVAGLEFADSGRILFGDVDATHIPVRDRGVGFVFQHYALFPHMTVAENIAFGMKVSRQRRSREEIAARVERLAPETFTTHVIMNNNMEDQGQRNAATLVRILEARRQARVPKLVQRRPEPARLDAQAQEDFVDVGEWVG